MNKACFATCLLAVLLPAKVWAADAPRCSDASVEKALPSLIVGASLGKAYGVRDFGYVGSDVTWYDIHYKFTIDKALVGGIVDFRFDAQRERRIDAAIGKRYCTANANGAINPSGLRAAIKVGTMGRRNEVQDRVLTPEEIAEATQDVEKKLVRFIRWNNPLNYSVQTLEKGGALVTLNESAPTLTSAKKAYFGLYLGLSVAASALLCFLYTPDGGRSVPTWVRFVATLAAIPAGFIGALIGDFIRRVTIPDAIFTMQGMWGILKAKLFWFCVPQLVGLFIGIGVVAGQILPKFHQAPAAPVATLPKIPSLAPGEWEDAQAVIAMITDASVRGNLSDITVLNYLSGQGKGALMSTSSGGRYLTLATVNPNNGATCELAAPLDAAMTLRDGECVVSVLGTPQDGMRTVQSRSCSDFCGMGASFDGQYVALSTIALQADHVGSDGKMVYRPK